MNTNRFDDIAPLYDHEVNSVIQELLTHIPVKRYTVTVITISLNNST